MMYISKIIHIILTMLCFYAMLIISTLTIEYKMPVIERLLYGKGGKTMTQEELYQEIAAQAEQSYQRLDGEWADWLKVSNRFEHKVEPQDRLDIRHTIILAFADQQARNERLGKPDLSFYGMLRIASHCIADYWRQKRRQLTILSLNTELEDIEGNTIELIDTLADDKAIDLDQWLDNATFLLGCKPRLIKLAVKRHNGIPLNENDRRYFNRQKAKEWARYQKTLL